MLSLLLVLFAAQGAPKRLDDFQAIFSKPVEAHVFDADEKKVVAAIVEHHRQYEWTREQGFASASTARHAVASLKSPSVFQERSLPLIKPFDHAVSVKLQSHGVPPALAAELLAAMRAANAGFKSFDTTGLPVVPIDCKDPAPQSRCDMTNAGSAISVSVPAFDASRTHALVLSLNDPQGLMGRGIFEMELSLLTKRNDDWVLTWHSQIGGWDSEWKAHETAVTPDDRAVFDAVLGRVAARVGRERCIRIVNESRIHDALEISEGVIWEKRAADMASAFDDMTTRSAEYIGDYKPRVRADLVTNDVLSEEEESKKFGSCGGVTLLTLPGFSKDRKTAVTIYTVGFLTSKGTEWGSATVLLRRKDTAWEVAEEKYELSALELKQGGPKPAPH